jgi:hypothetical protein
VDSLPENAALRARAGKGLGLVIVNLQQTPYDELTSLRIYAKLDDVMSLLARELGIVDLVKPMDHNHRPECAEGSVVEDDVFLVPFDEEGNPSPKKIVWDLREGRLVKLTGGPYAGDVGRIMTKNDAGHYRIRFENSVNHTFNVKRRPFSLWLGAWWLEEATRGFGICPGGKIPFVNVAESDQIVEVQHDEPVVMKPVQKPFSKIPPPRPPPPCDGKGKSKGRGKGR